MEDFYKKLQSLKNESWFRGENVWLDYFFHFTDIENAVEILKEGKLYCRKEAVTKGLMKINNASENVIQQNQEKTEHFVRLYFRPKTPTQFHNEGFRKPSNENLNSHCPMPIFFLFDAKNLTQREDFQFTNGNLANSQTKILKDFKDFEKLNFEEIYHEGSIQSPFTNENITNHRSTEVLFEQSLDLEPCLKLIYCRSEAEYQTLKNILPGEIKGNWKNKIKLISKAGLFFKFWFFIERVILCDRWFKIDFNVGEKIEDCTFSLKIKMLDRANNLEKEEEVSLKISEIKSKKSETFPFKVALKSYELKLFLDNKLAFSGEYSEANLLPY